MHSDDMLLKKEAASLAALSAVVRRLRGEGGCPWDRAQTHATLRRYLIEETYEVVEAIDKEDPTALREELGDLLLQILFHADMERERGRFDLADVADEEREKMIRRHPHVFGEERAETVLASWEENKDREKGRATLGERLATIPPSLPALMRAVKLLERGGAQLPQSAVGDPAAWERHLSLSGVRGSEDPLLAAGYYFLSAVAALRSEGIDPEEALTYAIRRLTEEITG